jgi:hypothetical protein
MLGSSRTFWPRRIVITAMTQQTRQPRMIGAAVLELRVIQPFRKLHLLLISEDAGRARVQERNESHANND